MSYLGWLTAIVFCILWLRRKPVPVEAPMMLSPYLQVKDMWLKGIGMTSYTLMRRAYWLSKRRDFIYDAQGTVEILDALTPWELRLYENDHDDRVLLEIAMDKSIVISEECLAGAMPGFTLTTRGVYAD